MALPHTTRGKIQLNRHDEQREQHGVQARALPYTAAKKPGEASFVGHDLAPLLLMASLWSRCVSSLARSLTAQGLDAHNTHSTHSVHSQRKLSQGRGLGAAHAPFAHDFLFSLPGPTEALQQDTARGARFATKSKIKQRWSPPFFLPLPFHNFPPINAAKNKRRNR